MPVVIKTRRRTGTTLVELIATLPLLAILALVSVLLVLNGQRVSRSVDGRTARNRELRHAAATIASELRSSRSRDLHAWNDTLIEFDATVGFGIVCDNSSANRVELLPADGSDAMRSTWSSAPDDGDRVHVSVTAANATAYPDTHDASITAVGGSVTACSNSTLRHAIDGSAVRLTITPALTAPAIIGAPARITRRTRLSLYRSSDNEWYMGMRTLRPSGWETTQPVTGPFTSAAERGLRFTVRSRDGAVLSPRTTLMPVDSTTGNSPIVLDLLLRAESKWKERTGLRETDSLVFSIALRNR